MKSKKEIVDNWLPRYTGTALGDFGPYVLLTNFGNYLEVFSRLVECADRRADRSMPNATGDGITMINIGMGSANAATVMDLLSAVAPKAVLFLGKCGGLKRKNQIGDLVLPIAAIRGEGTSNDYLLPEVPALPAFSLQRAISTIIRDLACDYWTGTVYTTNRRVWEHDDEFKAYLRKTRSMAIDMETATIFAAGFANSIPTGRAAAGERPADGARGREDRGLGPPRDRRVRRASRADRHRGAAPDPAPRQERQAPAIRRVVEPATRPG